MVELHFGNYTLRYLSQNYRTNHIRNSTIRLELSLQATAYSGNGAGHLGTPAGTIILSNVAQNIITGIGGAYTGNGAFRGHELSYSLTLLNHGLLDFDEATTIEITYTITD